MNDMTAAIIPKSDQMNSDDLIAGPITIKITDVTIRGGQEQPVSIHFNGDNGKPYKPCKSMSRVLVANWGADAKKYVGRSLTLYRDPTIKWAGLEIGGIRISHMSDIDSSMTMALTATKGSRKPFTVKPMPKSKEPAARPDGVGTAPSPEDAVPVEVAGQFAVLVSLEQIQSLNELLKEKNIPTAKLLAVAEKATNQVYLSLDQLPEAAYANSVTWIEKQKPIPT